jgi:superfamily I DNA and RNA helicase
MEINIDERRLRSDPCAAEIIELLKTNIEEIGLESAQIYYNFPILKDADDNIIIAKMLIISKRHGVIIINIITSNDEYNSLSIINQADSEIEHVFSLLFSRLIRNRQLRKTRTELLFPTSAIIYAPNLTHLPEGLDIVTSVVTNNQQMIDLLKRMQIEEIITHDYDELISTIEGAKGIIRPKPREISSRDPKAKGLLVNMIESEISSFDRKQKQGAMTVLDGFQRLRGLAGSGKTIVLAMKAALTHLQNPEARIVYTFYTKSLYQQIKRLITRFYRQFEDNDPDWTRLQILHGWGGSTTEGIYYNACRANNVQPMTLQEAKTRSTKDPFDYACLSLIEKTNISPMYDYMFIDEGQDFPASFIKLGIRLTEKNRVVFAYDDLQTIFQPATPAITEIVGIDGNGKPLVELTEDVILYKCYRNPREILLCAHALGFGIYGNIVQMLENREQWEDIGYRIRAGEFTAGSQTEIERPIENSLPTISANQTPDEIFQISVYPSFADEINGVIKSILSDLSEGLRPDDILVIVVDDRYAKIYLKTISDQLDTHGIQSNNMHTDSYGIKDFYIENQVTLSTVHKAKGNEAFMVYVLGVDSLYSSYAGVRERNILFTAITRAKGWVRLSGVGEAAEKCKEEVEAAKRNIPFLRFVYPGPEQLRIIKRDLAERAIRKQKAERKLDEVLDEMDKEDIISFIEQRSIKKGKGHKSEAKK